MDQAARLRNLRVQESQYLGILKRAQTVKDTLEISEKLNEVCAQIEQQAEFEALSKQVETVAFTIFAARRGRYAGVWPALASAVPAQGGGAAGL